MGDTVVQVYTSKPLRKDSTLPWAEELGNYVGETAV